MIVDSHCHLNCLDLNLFDNDLANVFKAASNNDVSHYLCVAIDWEHLDQVLAIAENYPNVFASVGVHPNEQDGHDPSFEELYQKSQHAKVIAIGETGLDYYRTTAEDEIKTQQNRFKRHIQVALKTAKPLIIHMRDADDDTLKLLQQEKADQIGGVMHCFASTWEVAKRALDLNFYISLSGIVTFKNAHDLHEVAKKTPLDKLLIETDCPYLAPMPHRGKPNSPTYLHHTAKHIAELRGMSYAELAKATTGNFFNLFNKAVK